MYIVLNLYEMNNTYSLNVFGHLPFLEKKLRNVLAVHSHLNVPGNVPS